MTENKNKKIMYSIIGIAILLISLVGVTYSFFNYTRTGALNNLGTGRIYFNSTQNGTLNMTNIFPLTSTQASSAQLDTVTVGIVGDTTYADGEEFEISLVDVTNTINGKKIPINYIATYAATTGNSIGTSSDTYWEARNSKNADIYLLNATEKVEEGKQVLVGYIKNGATGINGTLTIKAYVDADRIAITDTPEENTEWQQGRIVFSTNEWNSFATTPISFKIRAESNEGIWVNKGIESCPGCKYIYRVANSEDETTWLWTTWNMGGYDETNDESYALTPTQITSGIYDNYEELIATTGKNYFLGVKLNNNNEVTKAYACGVKDNVPFCIEGKLNSRLGGTEAETTYAINQSLLQGTNLYNNTCTVSGDTTRGYTGCGSGDTGDNTGSLSAQADSDGYVGAGLAYNGYCEVSSDGSFGCLELDSGGGQNIPLTMEEMCPGCVYAYTTDNLCTTWNTYSSTPSVLASGDYFENYEDVIAATGKNYFLGLKLNSNYQIEKAYACGVYNDTTPFCIEGYSDNSRYSANQTLLQGSNLYNNTCMINGDITTGITRCGLWDNSGFLSAETGSNGYVSAGVASNGYCAVGFNGFFGCNESDSGAGGGYY